MTTPDPLPSLPPAPEPGPRAWPLLPVRVFLGLLAALLLGYMFLGRGFAHVGIRPLYVSEIVLAMGVLATGWAAYRLRLRLPRDPVVYLLLAFMVLGLVRTVPYVAQYRLDALRDAVLWGYALFALMVVLVVDRQVLLRAVRAYGWVIPLFALWLPFAWNTASTISQQINPDSPGTDVPLIFFKNGDMAVHVAGSIAWLVLVAPPFRRLWEAAFRTLVSLPLAWTIYVTATISRGALLTSAGVLALLAVLRFRTRNWLPVLGGVALLVVLIAPSALRDLQGCNPNGDASAQQAADRDVSACQLIQNTVSIGGGSQSESLQGTKSFRLAWWGAIIDYTFRGPYFWTGKGFGVNLADDDGFQVNADHSLRAPHNSHLTALARMGVPGFALWGLLQAAFALGLLRAWLRFRRRSDVVMTGVAAWLLAYWAAMMVNTSFDPYLEGPQGGIWFWVVFGLGLVVMREARAMRPAAPPSAT